MNSFILTICAEVSGAEAGAAAAAAALVAQKRR